MVTQYDGRKAELLNALFVYCRFIASGVSLTPHIPGEKTQGCAQITKWFLYSSRTLICLAFSPRPAWRKYNLTAGILKPFCLTAKPNKANVTCHPGFRICFIGFIKRQRVVLLQIPSKYHFASKKANQKKKTGSALLIHNWNVLVLSEAVKDLIFHCVKQPRRQRGGIYVHCNKNKHSRCWSDLCCGKKKCYVSLVGGGATETKTKMYGPASVFTSTPPTVIKEHDFYVLFFISTWKKMITPPGSWNAQIPTGSSVLLASNRRRLQSGLKFLWIPYNQSASFTGKEAWGVRGQL